MNYEKINIESANDTMFRASSLIEKWRSDWEITPAGNLVSKANGYLIEKSRLSEKDWILHMSEKRWVDLNTFIPAYFKALKLAGHHTVSVTTCY